MDCVIGLPAGLGGWAPNRIRLSRFGPFRRGQSDASDGFVPVLRLPRRVDRG